MLASFQTLLRLFKIFADEAGLEMNSFTAVVDAKKSAVYLLRILANFANQIEYAKQLF